MKSHKITIAVFIGFLVWDGVCINYAKADSVSRTVGMQELCTTSTKLVRHTSEATKKAVYAAAGVTPRHSPECTGPSNVCDEVDHVWALTDGGADVIGNLQIQSYEGPCNAHQKDLLEVKLHHLICTDKTLTIDQAGAILTTDWVGGYTKYIDPKGCN
jgi:outer membrane murein-binding lipoprotein Lpp